MNTGSNSTNAKNTSAKTRSSQHETQANKVNARSSQTRNMWLGFFAFLLLIGALVTGGYFYLNREKPIVTVKIAAGPYRTDSYELLHNIAKVVERQSDWLRLNVVNTDNSSKNIALLNRGKVDMATIRSDTPVEADVQMIAELFPDFFQIITGPDSNINDIRDLLGKTIAIPPFGTDEFRSFWFVADHYDLSINGVNWRAMPFERAAKDLLSGKIDIIFTVRSLRDRLVLNLFEDAILKKKFLNVLEIDQAPAVSIKRPFLSSRSIPKGTYGGKPAAPLRDILSISVNRILVARKTLDPEITRELTRILFENRLDLIIRFALASAIQQPDLKRGLSIPLHEGAAQYFNRDQPSFLQENAEPIALVITIIAMLGSGLLALRSKLMAGQKNRMDSYNHQLLEMVEQARISENVDEIREKKSELFNILETVVRALDSDEVTEEGFQSFSLLWESVREMLNERLDELKEKS